MHSPILFVHWLQSCSYVNININVPQESLSTLCCEAFIWRTVVWTDTHSHRLWPPISPCVVYPVKCFYTLLDWVYHWRPGPALSSFLCWAQHFVPHKLYRTGWVGWMGVVGWSSCSHSSHTTQGWESRGRRPIRVEGLNRASKPATPLGNDWLVFAVLVNSVGVKIQGDALTVFTVQPRLLILSPLSPPSVTSVITRGPQHFAILWPDRYLQRTWILSCKNSELLSLFPLCSPVNM